MAVRPPKNLSSAVKKLWRKILEEYEITDAAGLQILQVALEALDRSIAARERIDCDGMMILDRFGAEKVHPLLKIEHMNRAAFLAGIRQLSLDIEVPEQPKHGVGRP